MTRVILTGTFCLFAAAALAQQPAFPGALGFGAYVSGGRSSTVYHVTSLGDSGSGSFRDAVSSSGRIIVFDVGGYISLSSAVSAKNRLTIAGQTAPGGGIGFKGGEISFANSTNIICRFIRIRPGSDTASNNDDALSLYRSSNVILDHCSFEFAPWNNIDGVGDSTHIISNVTFQNCIIANPTYQQFGCHSESINGAQWSWFYNLWVNGHNRQPLAKVNTVYINNVLYNFSSGYTTHTSTKFKHDIVNNYFICGPASGGGGNAFFQIDNNQSIYSTNNLRDTTLDGVLNGSTVNPLPGYQGGGTILTSPWAPTVTTNTLTLPTAQAVPYVYSRAGTLPRDEMDTLIVGQAQTLGNGSTGTGAGTAGPGGGLYTSQTQTGLGNNGYGSIAGGPAYVDGDQDGMPDYWELANGLDPANAADRNNLTSTGYTRVEEYLNWMASPHAIVQRWTTTTNTVNVDLWQYTAGYTNASPTYSLSSVSNGTVSLLGDGHTAQFTPTSNFFGLASFKFAVVATTGTMTDTVGVAVSSITPPVDLTWIGDGISNRWDNAISTNWTDGVTTQVFALSDGVTFDDSTTNTTVNVIGGVSPAIIEVNASQNYTFTNTGVISGTAVLTKDGAGTLVLATSNTFGGGLIINAGAVTLVTNASPGSGVITLNGATLNNNATIANAINITDNSSLNCGASQVTGGFSGNSIFYITISGSGNPTFTHTGTMSSFGGTLQFGNSKGFFRLNGNIGSSAATFDLGTNTVTMNERAGHAAITLGALFGGPGTFLRGASSAGTNNTTFFIGGLNADCSFAGSMLDGGALQATTSVTKVGSGKFTLTGTNQYSGTTTISNGTLVVAGVVSNSPFSVLSGGTLAGNGKITGGVTVRAGAALRPGDGVGTLACGNLTLTNCTAYFDLAPTNTVGAGVNDLIVLSGSFTLRGTSTIQPVLLSGVLSNGTYTLITGGTSTTGSTANLTFGIASPSRPSFALDMSTPGSLLLNVTGNPATLSWQGNNGTAWNLNSTTNWLNAGNPDVFLNFDAIYFDDTATSGNVDITSTVQPRSLVVSNSSLAFTMTSTNGLIAGTTSLVKNGSGTLALHGSNTFSGSLIINAGTVAVNSNSAAGTGPIILNGGTLNNNATIANAIVVTAPSTIICPNSQITGGISGNSMLSIIVTAGQFTVTGLMTNFTGTLYLGASTATFRLNQTTTIAGSPAATFDLGTNTGTLLYRGFTGGYTCYFGALAGGQNTRLLGAGSVTNTTTTYVIGDNNASTLFAGRISNGTTLDSFTAITKVGSGTWTLTGTNSDFTAGTEISEGTVLANNTSGNCLGVGDVQVDAGATLGGSGFIGAAVTYADGAILTAAGMLTFNSDLNLGDGTTLLFDLGSNSDTVVVNGALNAAGFLNITNAGGFGVGNYVLFTCSAATNLNFGNLTIASAPTGFVYTLDTNTPGQVILNVAPPLTPFQQWQINYFGSTNDVAADANSDPDGDGQNNQAEFLAGTTPTNSTSAFRILSTVPTGNDVLINWQTAGGRTNAVQVTGGDYNTNFTDVSDPIIIPGGGDMTTNYTDTGGATNNPSRYYRIRLVP